MPDVSDWTPPRGWTRLCVQYLLHRFKRVFVFKFRTRPCVQNVFYQEHMCSSAAHLKCSILQNTHVQGVQYLLHCWCSNCVLYLNTCSWTRANVQYLVFKQCSSWWICSVPGVQTAFFSINTKVFNITEHVQSVQYLLQFWRSDGVLNLNIHFYSVVCVMW